MVVTDLISAGIILILTGLSYLDMIQISILLVFQVMMSLLNGLFEPATRGMLPNLVDKEELIKSNSLVSSMRSASIMLGPVVGATLYASFGITIVFLVNGISFLLSGISEMMIQYKLSIASTFIIVPIQSYIQKETPNQYISRVFSLIALISRGGILLGALIYGLTLEKVVMHWTLMVTTILMILFSIGFTTLLLKNKEI